MLMLPMSNAIGAPPFSSGAFFAASAGFLPSASVRSEKLNLPSLALTMRAFRPFRLTESTMYWPRKSGISFTEACAESNATNVSFELRSENETPETCAPRLGQKAILMSPWMASVRPVFSLASCSICPL